MISDWWWETIFHWHFINEILNRENNQQTLLTAIADHNKQNKKLKLLNTRLLRLSVISGGAFRVFICFLFMPRFSAPHWLGLSSCAIWKLSSAFKKDERGWCDRPFLRLVPTTMYSSHPSWFPDCAPVHLVCTCVSCVFAHKNCPKLVLLHPRPEPFLSLCLLSPPSVFLFALQEVIS